MKKFGICVALLTVTAVITASDQKKDKPKANPAVERVKKTDSASNIDRSAGGYLNGGNRRVVSSNKRPRPTQKLPETKNPNT